MRTLPKFLTVLAAIATAFGSTLVSASTANAVAWVSSPTWSNLHVKTENGVFERFKREFDNSSVLQTQSETQHNQAWVRTDRNDVTIQYVGGVSNANKQVQFVLDGDQPFTDSVDGADNIVVTDATGYAEITVTLTNDSKAEDVLRADISNGTDTIGTMVILFQDPGYFPVVKLVGTATGPEAVCSTTNLDVSTRTYPHQCLDSDLTEETWGWSVFKKSWLPEYSQVYVKSYLPGATMALKYKVTDIWGTPIAAKQVQLIVDPKCRLCKWGTYRGTKNTDVNGYVSFTVPNKNTAKEILANSFVNSDTKAREHGIIAFSVLPTTNELEESVDHFWPQLVSNIDIKTAASTLTTFTRGLSNADISGNVVVTQNGQISINPPLELDTLGTSAKDTNTVTLNITYLKNSLPIILYAPDIKVTATNGGRVGLVTPSRQPEYYSDISKMSSSLTFGYTYPQKFVLACTKPGTTVFSFAMGKTKKTYEIECVLEPGTARHIKALNDGQIGVLGKAAQSSFLVSDRFGNGISGISVDLTLDGTTTRVVTDAKGVASLPVTSTVVSDQTVQASVVTDGLTSQFAEAAVPEKSILAGNTTASAVTKWGKVQITATAGKGIAKLRLVNGKGLPTYVLDGKKKTVLRPATQDWLTTLKLTKGVHRLTISVGATKQIVSVTVL